MKQQGKLIFWEINDVRIEVEKLIDAGFDKYLPRNSPKTALIKALRITTKGNEKFYKKFADTKESVRFAIVRPEVVLNDKDIDIDFNKEITIILDKSSNVISLTKDYDDTNVINYFEKIKSHYNNERGMIDSLQFRMIVLKFIKKEIFGVSMKQNGGVYFVDDRKIELLKRLRTLFSTVGGSCIMHEIPVYRNNDTMAALEYATFENFNAEINEFIGNFENANFSKTFIKNRYDDIEEMVEKIKFFKGILSNRFDTLKIRLTSVEELIDSYVTGEKIKTFEEELMMI